MMEDKDKILDEIFSNDPLGLLNVKLKTSNVKTADERLTHIIHSQILNLDSSLAKVGWINFTVIFLVS